MTCRWTCARGTVAGQGAVHGGTLVWPGPSVDVADFDDRGDAAHGWWDALEDDVLECLRRNGALSPSQLAGFLGFSEATATSLITMLAAERRIRISRVELDASAQADLAAAA